MKLNHDGTPPRLCEIPTRDELMLLLLGETRFASVEQQVKTILSLLESREVTAEPDVDRYCCDCRNVQMLDEGEPCLSCEDAPSRHPNFSPNYLMIPIEEVE